MAAAAVAESGGGDCSFDPRDVLHHQTLLQHEQDNNGRRVYVNFTMLLSFFETMSVHIRRPANKDPTAAAAAAATKSGDCTSVVAAATNTAATSSSSSSPLDHLMRFAAKNRETAAAEETTNAVRIGSHQIMRQYREYEREYREYAQTIAACVNRAVEAAGKRGAQRFVQDMRERDYYTGSVNLADDVATLRTDLSETLLFSMMSLVRHSTQPLRYTAISELTYDDKIKMFDDYTHESHRVVLVYTMAQLYQAHVSLSQI